VAKIGIISKTFIYVGAKKRIEKLKIRALREYQTKTPIFASNHNI